MTVKCPCIHCGGHIEFALADFTPVGHAANETIGQKVNCPHCGLETILRLPKNKDQAKLPKTQPQTHTVKCPACEHLISRKALMCPECGHADGVRFSFVWHIMCQVLLANIIFAIVGAIIYAMYVAAISSWK